MSGSDGVSGQRQDSRTSQLGQDCDGWPLVASDHLSVTQERIPPNRAEERHYHERVEQFFLVLSGGVDYLFAAVLIHEVIGDQPDQRQSRNCLSGPKSFVNYICETGRPARRRSLFRRQSLH